MANRKYKHVGPEEQLAILQRAAQGLNKKQIAAEFEVAESTVYNILKRHGTSAHEHQAKKREEVRRQVALFYGQGLSGREIARRLGVHRDVVKQHITALNREAVAQGGEEELPMAERQRLLAKIHIAKKQLKLEEEPYRELLERLTGRRSAKDMGITELTTVLQEFERLGFKVQGGKGKLSPQSCARAYKTQSDKIRALWIECWKVGVVQNRYEEGLQAWIKRQYRVERVEWLTYGQASLAIEALKQMHARGAKDGKRNSLGVRERVQSAGPGGAAEPGVVAGAAESLSGQSAVGVSAGAAKRQALAGAGP